MDKEGAYLILKTDASQDLGEVSDEVMFEIKNYVFTSKFHPKLFENKIMHFKKKVSAIRYLSQDDIGNQSKSELELRLDGDILQCFNQKESLLAKTKLKFAQSNDLGSLLLLLKEYHNIQLLWLKELAAIQVGSHDDIKETEYVDSMTLQNLLIDWSEHNFDENQLETTTFVALKKEILRARKVINSY